MRKTPVIFALCTSVLATGANADIFGSNIIGNIGRAIDGAGILQALQQQQAAEKAAVSKG
jgi:hypothetical protein